MSVFNRNKAIKQCTTKIMTHSTVNKTKIYTPTTVMFAILYYTELYVIYANRRHMIKKKTIDDAKNRLIALNLSK